MRNLNTRAKNGGNDAYFTHPDYAQHCADMTFRHVARDALFIEPSAGDGAFIDAVDGRHTIKGYDINPQSAGIEKRDWFTVSVPKHCAVIGNPPFGFAANLAVKFFNHAATGADTIAFIVPRSFQKRSVQAKLNAHFRIVHEELCPSHAFIVEGQAHDVPCVFQVWVRSKTQRAIPATVEANPYFVFTTRDKANFAVRRVGGRAGEVLPVEGQSGSTTYFVKTTRAGAKAALRACMPALAVLRDQTAGVRSLSKHEINATLCAYALGVQHG